MSTLQERLDRIRADFDKRAPAEAKAIMQRAGEDLLALGILERIPRPGDALPAFELSGSGGELVRSSDLLARGPLVLSFYRGMW